MDGTQVCYLRVNELVLVRTGYPKPWAKTQIEGKSERTVHR